LSGGASFAASVGLFAIVVAIALLLTGIGFIVLASGLIGPIARLRRRVAGAAPITPAAAH